jgi:hypothetical protein
MTFNKRKQVELQTNNVGRPIWKNRAWLATLIIVNVLFKRLISRIIWLKFFVKTEGYNREYRL